MNSWRCDFVNSPRPVLEGGTSAVLSMLARICIMCVLVLLASRVYATDPEIMLHESDTAEKGDLIASLHSNYTLNGIKETGDRTWPEQGQTNLMAEFATGLAHGWEVGVHLPIRRAGVDSSSSSDGAWGSSGVMLRLKHVSKLENGYFYGFNSEYDTLASRFYNAPHGLEFRSIAGRDTEDYRVTFNPVVSRGLGGDDASSKLDFRLDAKVLRKLSERTAWGIEAYTRWGKLGDLHPGTKDRVIYLVGEFKLLNDSTLHVGVGQGDRDAPEKTVLKAVWATRF